MERRNEPLRSIAPRRIPVAMIACALTAAPFALPPVAGAQQAGAAAGASIIEFVQERPKHAAGAGASLSRSVLTTEQAAVLDTIRSDPAASGIRIGRSVPAALAAVPAARAFSIPVPDGTGTALAFTGVDVAHNEQDFVEKDFVGQDLVSLHAQDAATDSEVSLVVQGPDVLGSIRHGADVYKVHPLGEGLTAVYRYDTSMLRRHPPGWGAYQRRYAPKPRPAEDGDAPGAATDTGATDTGATDTGATDTGDVIDLMVAYTPAARREAGNIDAFIQFAIDNTHRIYRNSDIGFRLRLVHKHQVSYTQHENMGLDLDRLYSPDDGYMDEVHGLRDRYRADLVALIVGRSSIDVCGVAFLPDFGVLPDHDFSDQGFSVTAHNCETSTLHTFAHELGHNQGAAHDPDNSCEDGMPPCSLPPPPTIQYRYGRCNTAEGWNTTMSYEWSTRGPCPREIEYFSSPALTFRGTPTGDAARRDNRRVLLETARRVANFRRSQPEPPPPDVDLHATLPYVAPAGGRHPSLVRVLNDSAQPNTVQVTGYDDVGRRFGPERLSLGAHEATTLTTTDLEAGRPDFAGLGDGEGWWRLELEGERPFRAGMYYRRGDGSMAGLSAPVAGEEDGTGGWRYDVGFFNPGSNTAKVSMLRLANTTDRVAQVIIAGRDDRGREAPGGTVGVRLPAQGAATHTAQALETGGDGLTGRLGDGEGKWRLTVTADRPVVVMSLLHATRTGHLANLSAIAQGAPTATDASGPVSRARQAFEARRRELQRLDRDHR